MVREHRNINFNAFDAEPDFDAVLGKMRAGADDGAGRPQHDTAMDHGAFSTVHCWTEPSIAPRTTLKMVWGCTKTHRMCERHNYHCVETPEAKGGQEAEGSVGLPLPLESLASGSVRRACMCQTCPHVGQ